jgi:hypothetical protein
MKCSDDGKLPHSGVYVRLQASPIHGVGVFAIRNISEGTYIFPDDNEEIVWLDKSSLARLTGDERKLYDDFCIIKGDLYGCPRSFNELTPAWYLNESPMPNVASDNAYRFFATRDINKGEELTINYDAYSDRPEKGA